MEKEKNKTEVEQISHNPQNLMYQVGEYVVRIFKKPGRTLITCTCFNGTMFLNEPTWCKHKEEAIKFRWRKNEV